MTATLPPATREHGAPRNVQHPTDQAAQDRLSTQLVALRMTQYARRHAEYARLVGVHPDRLWRFEHPDRVNLSVLTAVRRAAPLGRHLAVDLTGLPDVSGDLLVAYLARRRPTDPLEAAENTAALLVTQLNAARLELNVTVAAVAARMGIVQASVSSVHNHHGATLRLSTVQRYARALGGRAVLRLDPVTPPPARCQES